MTNAEKVAEFHRVFKHVVRQIPTAEIPEAATRLRLISEEFEEYIEALEDKDLVGIADALADLLYVVYGTAICHGIDIDPIFHEVHRSNMTKLGLDGEPVLREDGKCLKGPNYEPPQILPILQRQGLSS